MSDKPGPNTKPPTPPKPRIINEGFNLGRVWGNYFKRAKEDVMERAKSKFDKYDCKGGDLDDKVNIAFNHIDKDTNIPKMRIDEYQNGTARIIMADRIIPSLCREYSSLCLAKKAILEWIEAKEPLKVVKSTTIGS